MGRRTGRGRACFDRPFGPLSMKEVGDPLGMSRKRGTNAPHPEPAAARGRVEGMGRRTGQGRACFDRPFGPLSMKEVGDPLGMRRKRGTNAPHPEPAAERGRVEGWAGAPAEAVRASTGPSGRSA